MFTLDILRSFQVNAHHLVLIISTSSSCQRNVAEPTSASLGSASAVNVCQASSASLSQNDLCIALSEIPATGNRVSTLRQVTRMLHHLPSIHRDFMPHIFAVHSLGIVTLT